MTTLINDLIDLARALPGPAWLRDARIAAAQRATAMPFPSVEDEIWRYSRIGELDVASFDRAAQLAVTSPTVVDAAALVTSVDGDSDPALAPLVAAPVGTADLFSELNLAGAELPVVVRIPAGRVVEAPIVVDNEISIDGVVRFPRLVIDAGPNSEVTVVERFRSTDVRALVCPVVSINAADSARVRYLAINELGPATWLIAHQVAVGGRDSTVSLASVAFGGDYSRVRTEVSLIGVGAHAEQIGVSFGERSQMHDLRVLQDHVAPRTTSNLLFKGAVQDHARSVYTGLIKMGKNARGSSAFQTNRNLKLSEGAWAESVPNLDIETNDVRCSHASAVGPIDAEQRFYLESRGVPPSVAERLIVLGFFDEVLAKLPDPGVVAGLHAAVAAKLDRRHG